MTLTKGEAEGGGPCGTEEWMAFKNGLLQQQVHDEKSLDWLLASARA
jgi:hypothetical protein